PLRIFYLKSVIPIIDSNNRLQIAGALYGSPSFQLFIDVGLNGRLSLTPVRGNQQFLISQSKQALNNNVGPQQGNKLAKKIGIFLQGKHFKRPALILNTHDRTFYNVEVVKLYKFYLWKTVDLVCITEHHFMTLPGKTEYGMYTNIQRAVFNQFQGSF